MPTRYDINQIVLLDQQRMIHLRLKKGDFIYVGKEGLPQVQSILKKYQVVYVINDHSFNVMMITVN